MKVLVLLATLSFTGLFAEEDFYLPTFCSDRKEGQYIVARGRTSRNRGTAMRTARENLLDDLADHQIACDQGHGKFEYCQIYVYSVRGGRWKQFQASTRYKCSVIY